MAETGCGASWRRLERPQHDNDMLADNFIDFGNYTEEKANAPHGTLITINIRNNYSNKHLTEDTATLFCDEFEHLAVVNPFIVQILVDPLAQHAVHRAARRRSHAGRHHFHHRAAGHEPDDVAIVDIDIHNRGQYFRLALSYARIRPPVARITIGRSENQHLVTIEKRVMSMDTGQHDIATQGLPPEQQRLITAFGLTPHPEGGFFRETYRAPAQVVRRDDDARAPAPARSASTAIYFMLGHGAVSAWHRIRSDELWHFYAGSPFIIHVLGEGRAPQSHRLGNPLTDAGASFQVLVPAGLWFAAECSAATGWGLAGCTVAPGFEFSEFTLAGRDDLTAMQHDYPGHRPLIERFAPPIC
jgi:predicted cupin superfamily sugar epimerase